MAEKSVAIEHGLAARLDRGIGWFLEATTAVLVVAEIIILFAGILARYVFHRPLVWSDELASILFLWLAVLGSALAFRRGENLRMMTLVNKLSTASQQRLELIVLAASLAFLVLALPPAIKHVEIEFDRHHCHARGVDDLAHIGHADRDRADDRAGVDPHPRPAAT